VILDDDAPPELLCKNIHVTSRGYAIFYSKITQRMECVHKYIIGATQGQTVDHINGDRLDNRRCNLRVCTVKENTRNRLVYGYHLIKKNGKVRYRARVTVDGKRIHLGNYSTPEQAVKAYEDYYRTTNQEYRPRIRPIAPVP